MHATYLGSAAYQSHLWCCLEACGDMPFKTQRQERSCHVQDVTEQLAVKQVLVLNPERALGSSLAEIMHNPVF